MISVTFGCTLLSLPALAFSSKESRARIFERARDGLLFGANFAKQFIHYTSPIAVIGILHKNQYDLTTSAIDAVASTLLFMTHTSMLGYSAGLLQGSIQTYFGG